MRTFLVVVAFVVCAGCGNLSTPAQKTLDDKALLGVQTLGTMSKGVEALADSKIITNHEAHLALDKIKVMVGLIKAGNTDTVTGVNEVIKDLQMLPFAAKLDKLLFAAKIAITPVSSSQQIDGQGIINLVQLFLPAVMGFIQKRRALTGQDPSHEEMKQLIAKEADTVLTDIDVYEMLHPDVPEIPVDPA